MCLLFSCLFLFVTIAKMCRREEISCFFQSDEEAIESDQVLEVKGDSKGCKIWRLNKKSHVMIQNSSFIIGSELNKEKFENFYFNPFASERPKWELELLNETLTEKDSFKRSLALFSYFV